jgi:hypothetical protein
MKRILITLCAFIALFMSSLCFAGGLLFNITESGNSGLTDIVLCLDGRGPTSCQNYTVDMDTLSITTAFPNHTYPSAGILVTTPGFFLQNPGIECTMLNNGYCVFSVSGTKAVTITLGGGIVPTPATTLTATPSLTLSITGLTTTTGTNSGTARQITITNTGSNPATNVNFVISPALPSGATITPANCGTMAAGATCVLTVTPGSAPTNAVASSSPTPSVVGTAGDNTNTVATNVNILTYGSLYEAGWLYSIIETAGTSPSIGGSVAAQTDSVIPSIGTEYSPGGAATVAATSGTNGKTNTTTMSASYGTAANYSAGNCIPPNYSFGGFTDWYLPSDCQLGFGGSDTNFNCTNSTSADYIPNVQANLLTANATQNFNFVNGGFYWSSTASVSGAPSTAWFQQIAQGGGSGTQTNSAVTISAGVRCVRDVT